MTAMVKKTATNATPPIQKTTIAERTLLLNQQPVTLWLTGLSASGKSTLAYSMQRKLVDLGKPCFVLDGDVVRNGLNSDLSFSPEDRTENIRRVAEVARLMSDAGLIVIAALISPLRADRALAKSIIGASLFREVHVSTSLNICEARDPKGLYRRARSGEVVDFTGISAPYEVPADPALAIDTQHTSIDDAIAQMLALTTHRAAPVQIDAV